MEPESGDSLKTEPLIDKTVENVVAGLNGLRPSLEMAVGSERFSRGATRESAIKAVMCVSEKARIWDFVELIALNVAYRSIYDGTSPEVAAYPMIGLPEEWVSLMNRHKDDLK